MKDITDFPFAVDWLEANRAVASNDWHRGWNAARKELVRLQALAPARPAPTRPANSQDWAGMSGATAFILIERHSDNWVDADLMMNEWRAANPAQPAALPESSELLQRVERLRQDLLTAWRTGADDLDTLCMYAVRRFCGIKGSSELENITQPAALPDLQCWDLDLLLGVMNPSEDGEGEWLSKDDVQAAWPQPAALPALRVVTDEDVICSFRFADGWNHSQADKARYRAALEAYEARKAALLAAEGSKPND